MFKLRPNLRGTLDYCKINLYELFCYTTQTAETTVFNQQQKINQSHNLLEILHELYISLHFVGNKNLVERRCANQYKGNMTMWYIIFLYV